jgi:hypothetical protein
MIKMFRFVCNSSHIMSNIISYSISDRNYYQSDVNNATHAQFIEEVNIYYSPK